MSLSNFIPDDGSLWSIRAVDISGNYNQKLSLDASGNAIIITGNTDRLTINSSGAWTCQGGMTYNNSTNTLTAGTFSGTATTATNIAGGIASQIPYQRHLFRMERRDKSLQAMEQVSLLGCRRRLCFFIQLPQRLPASFMLVARLCLVVWLLPSCPLNPRRVLPTREQTAGFGLLQ